MTEHVAVITQMVSDELSMLYLTVADVEDKNDHSDKEYIVSSESESDDNNEAEEKRVTNSHKPCHSKHNMGSGSPIDNLIESGTLRLLDSNPSMTDIQLGMRFVDKVQAISAVQKWSIRMGREYRVV
ncbi:hypothetical protein M9H77_07752 [Catharanthus roseus]|uniref:Uncharacterized protein n=1 Tax=Catharanthus roseus TaxID=4058 RepID=A0ACC0BW21_CATRO|nr:hypothetical protein M9H77_07752 [Catharanthus roseus]